MNYDELFSNDTPKDSLYQQKHESLIESIKRDAADVAESFFKANIELFEEECAKKGELIDCSWWDDIADQVSEWLFGDNQAEDINPDPILFKEELADKNLTRWDLLERYGFDVDITVYYFDAFDNLLDSKFGKGYSQK